METAPNICRTYVTINADSEVAGGGGSKSFVTNCYRFTGQHGSLVEKLPTFETYILHDVTILFERPSKTLRRKPRELHWGISGFLYVSRFFVVGLEVSFQKTQGIDAYAASFTDGSSLLSCADRNFFEHRSD